MSGTRIGHLANLDLASAWEEDTAHNGSVLARSNPAFVSWPMHCATRAKPWGTEKPLPIIAVNRFAGRTVAMTAIPPMHRQGIGPPWELTW